MELAEKFGLWGSNTGGTDKTASVDNGGTDKAASIDNAGSPDSGSSDNDGGPDIADAFSIEFDQSSLAPTSMLQKRVAHTM